MRRTNFCRAEKARHRPVVHAPKPSPGGFKAEGDVTGGVFEETNTHSRAHSRMMRAPSSQRCRGRRNRPAFLPH